MCDAVMASVLGRNTESSSISRLHVAQDREQTAVVCSLRACTIRPSTRHIKHICDLVCRVSDSHSHGDCNAERNVF